MNRKELGGKGEAAAGAFLSRQGFRILDRNYRTRFGEIDLFCQDGSGIVFVEVKTKQSGEFAPPLASVTERKRAKLRQLAEEYLISHRLEAVEARFDVLSIVIGPGAPEIEHIRGAF